MIITENHKEEFERIISKYDKFAIVPHYNPDPDSLGSSFGLYNLLTKHFNKEADIYYGGIIGRAENKAMFSILNIPTINIKGYNDIPKDIPVILMDTQTDTGNNPLAEGSIPLMIFDHHPEMKKSKKSDYADIRLNYGSTSTIIYEYYSYYGAKIPVDVAVGLYYGIETDVVGEGRNANKIDFKALEELSKIINRKKLYAIENPKLPFDYYVHINKGLENSVIYDDFIISSLGEIKNPDYIGEIADFLIRFDKANLVLIMGKYGNSILLSFRSQKNKVEAGFTLKEIVGKMGTAGGHSINAGGRIEFEDPLEFPKMSKKIITNALNILQGKITTGIPLLSLGDYLNIDTQGGIHGS